MNGIIVLEEQKVFVELGTVLLDERKGWYFMVDDMKTKSVLYYSILTALFELPEQ